MENKHIFEHYSEGVFYQIELTAKYIKRMGLNHFNQLNIDIGPEEFLALDIIYLNPGICQRDLAKKLLKDRAGTGRILLTLEAKGLVERFVSTKGNRLVRNMKLTPKGEEALKQSQEKLIPSIMKLKEIFPKEDCDELKRILEKLRKILSDNVETQI
ncbi:MAG: MarR family winged helix-turn-helix transcriptional regulator [Candidatus Gastranaerophilaceae bacterium]